MGNNGDSISSSSSACLIIFTPFPAVLQNSFLPNSEYKSPIEDRTHPTGDCVIDSVVRSKLEMTYNYPLFVLCVELTNVRTLRSRRILIVAFRGQKQDQAKVTIAIRLKVEYQCF